MQTTRIRCAVLVTACVAGAAHAQCDTQTINTENLVEGIEFGASLALQGEWLFVGAPEDGAFVDDAGAVHVYRFVGDAWTPFEIIASHDLQEFDDFGRSVSVDGDRLIVGAPGTDPVENNEGAAYVFEFNGETWGEVDKLTADETNPGDRFGWDVSLQGDLVIVGAFGADIAENSAGAAYAIRFDGDNWVEEGILVAEDAASLAQLGRSVAVDGDRALVGAWQDDDFGFFTGSAYTFTFDGETWSQEDKLVASDAAEFAWFGLDVDLDGAQAIVGAYGDGEGGLEAGAAYVFVLEGDTWNEQAKLTAADAMPSAKFGWSVAIDGADAWVGAIHESEAAPEAGAAYLYRYSGFGWVELEKFSSIDGAEGADLGASIDAELGQGVIGAPNWNQDGTLDAGAVIALSACRCPADFNGDGGLNVLDFVSFQLAWVAQNSSADCDVNGEFNVLDFVCFQLVYDEGCR